ncbi:MAG: hypothetical protein QOH97_1158 [Actinoplanes sp.]|nr:hypothetical protein [Actinoplanes sp.]
MTIGERDPVRTPVRARAALSKVPEITAWFWVIKVLTTGMGETASDWLAHTLAPPVAVGLGAIALIASLALQFTARRYVAWIYWLAAERDRLGRVDRPLRRRAQDTGGVVAMTDAGAATGQLAAPRLLLV